MITFNQSITIYNRISGAHGADTWLKTLINDASWHGAKSTTASTTGQSEGNVYKIRILATNPLASGYLDPKDYNALTDKTGFWTIAENDRIVKGIATINITKPSELSEAYSVVCTVTGWSNNTGESLGHWRVDAK